MSDTYSEDVFVIHPYIKRDADKSLLDDQLAEACELTKAIKLNLKAAEKIGLDHVYAGYFFGSGTRNRLKEIIDDKKIQLVVVNHALSPVQQRNLEKEFQVKVIDRTGLILEIFGARAQTKEGRIQVDLAQLQYQRSRLVRSWTHLERQRGGAGFMGGPGERQIELDRRIIDDKINQLKKDLGKVRKTRQLGRDARSKIPFPVVALVGYTNAGKSTLFNTLTNSDVFAENLLFATLDPTMRKIELPSGQGVVLSDTVGFITSLPTQLIEAFRATLEQVQHADVILHIRDMTQKHCDSHKQDVIDILHDLGIEYETDDRIIEVFNKIDLLDDVDKDYFKNKARRDNNLAAVSALTGEGAEELYDLIDQKITAQWILCDFTLPSSQGKLISWLYDHAHVTNLSEEGENMVLSVKISHANKARFDRMVQS